MSNVNFPLISLSLSIQKQARTQRVMDRRENCVHSMKNSSVTLLKDRTIFAGKGCLLMSSALLAITPEAKGVLCSSTDLQTLMTYAQPHVSLLAAPI